MGGYIGVTGYGSYSEKYGDFYAYGGTQTEGGEYSNYSDKYSGSYGDFGLGGSCASSSEGNCSGGGGGFYGGSSNTNYSGAGGGGSGYIGNELLTDKVMYCYKCEESSQESTKTVSTINVSEESISNYAKIGNGYAKIIYLGD